jgi:hypothetical protein
LLTFAAVVAAVALVASRSNGAGSPVPCYVGEGQIDEAIAAPADLAVEPVYFPGGYWFKSTWHDNDDAEACYVVERGQGSSVPGADFAAVATLEPGSTCLVDASDIIYNNTTITFYRVYAATDTSRSLYSEALGLIGPVDYDLGSPVPPTPDPGCYFLDLSSTSSPSPTAPAGTPAPRVMPVPGDVNCDGGVDALDALWLLRFVASLPHELPPGCPPIGY